MLLNKGNEKYKLKTAFINKTSTKKYLKCPFAAKNDCWLFLLKTNETKKISLLYDF